MVQLKGRLMSSESSQTSVTASLKNWVLGLCGRNLQKKAQEIRQSSSCQSGNLRLRAASLLQTFDPVPIAYDWANRLEQIRKEILDHEHHGHDHFDTIREDIEDLISELHRVQSPSGL